jgi:predicted nucleic acid-binding protein
MIIFDTSVWINALNGQSSKAVDLLVSKTLSNEVVLLPIIIQEILQGIKDDLQFEKIKANLSGFVILEYNNTENAIGAAALYRNLRKNGLTIRKPNDSLIAFIAIDNDLELVHNDSDFDLIASCSQLRILKV